MVLRHIGQSELQFVGAHPNYRFYALHTKRGILSLRLETHLTGKVRRSELKEGTDFRCRIFRIRLCAAFAVLI
jgi:hypothetical protein